jgi:amino acid transporter
MQKHTKPLGILSLVLMNVVIVGSLQMLTFTAVYGYALFLFYAIATVTFFIPTILMAAELATSWPITGGPYIWVEHAFGKNMGFFTICILWFCNLIWYPTIFSLIATGAFYLIDPALATNQFYMFLAVTSLFWFMTFLNSLGIRISSQLSNVSSVTGVIIPAILIITLAAYWVMKGMPSQITLNKASLLPSLAHIGNLAFLTQIIVSLGGSETSAVHAGDVINPKRAYPLALFYSSFIILFVLIATVLGIAMVIPSKEIGVVSGLLDAMIIFANAFHVPGLLFLLLLLITLGNFGCAAAWMIGSTRGMSVACQHAGVHPWLQKTNGYNAPVGILILEAVIFTVISLAFWAMPTVGASYWLLLQIASLIGMVYIMILFASLVRLRYKGSQTENHFRIPGKNWGVWVTALLGGSSCVFGFVVGLIPPEQTQVGSTAIYVTTLLSGVFIGFSIPAIMLKIAKKGLKNSP